MSAQDLDDHIAEIRRTLDAGPPAGDRAVSWFAGDALDVVGTAVADDPGAALPAMTALWGLVGRIGPAVGERFCTGLRKYGAVVQESVPPSADLAALFRASGAVAIARGVIEAAEVQAIRELKVRTQLGDAEGEAFALARLARVFRAQGRWHRVMDVSDQVVALRRRTKDRPGVAQALRMVGQVLVEAGSASSSLLPLERARVVQAEVGHTPPRRVAGLAVLTGLARWLTGSRTIARREFRSAAAVLAEAGDDSAARVEALLDVRPRGDGVPELGDLLWLGAEDLHKCDADLYEQARVHAEPAP